MYFQQHGLTPITGSDIFPAERFESGRNTVTEINYLNLVKADIEEADDKIP